VIRGEADEEPGTQAGDLVFIIHQMPHAVFTRKVERSRSEMELAVSQFVLQDSDLYVKKTISLREALTGVDFKIAHLDGRILHVKVCNVSQYPLTRFFLDGAGRYHSSRRKPLHRWRGDARPQTDLQQGEAVH
jgi:DnaJ-class molecular chaperone